MRRGLAAVIGMTALTACNSPGTDGIEDSPDAYIYSAKEKLKETLKDPDRAQFRNVVAYNLPTDNGEKVYVFCGEVNAKNGFGGYTGYERFVGNGGMIDLEGERGAAFAEAWATYCKPTLKAREMPYF